jgi:hypothetical protein
MGQRKPVFKVERDSGSVPWNARFQSKDTGKGAIITRF